MVVRWFMPWSCKRRRLLALRIWLYGGSCYELVNGRLLTLHIWSYGSLYYGAVIDEDYLRWFINDIKLSFDKAAKGNSNIICANLLNVMCCSMERDERLRRRNCAQLYCKLCSAIVNCVQAHTTML